MIDLETRECAEKEIIKTPFNTIILGTLDQGYVQLSHKQRGPRQVIDYHLAVYTHGNACVEVDGTDHQDLPRPSKRWHAEDEGRTLASRTDQRVGIVFDRWIGNYYHWMVFCVPKLILLSELFGVERFFMPNDLTSIPSFVWQTLELLGLPPEALIPISSGIHHAAELCFVHGAWPSPYTCRLTRRRLSLLDSGRQPPERKKVFLLRKANTNIQRALVNEADVLCLCAQAGIEPVDPGGLSLREQIALFQGVDLVIGVHGAAIANMLWMPTGSNVIEIATGMQPHYRSLAEHLGLTWMSLLARNEDSTVAGHNGQFVINEKVLEKLIKIQE